VTRLAAGLPVTVALLLGWLAAAWADAARGEIVFQRCYACHSVKAGENGLTGPNLRGILGRRAGTLPGFEFSPGMIEAGSRRNLVWTRKTLDAFLTDPQRVVPGTSMSMPPLPSAADRLNVIDYLELAARALRFQSSHGRGIVPARDACAFLASSGSR
jgi:cytochrome c2